MDGQEIAREVEPIDQRQLMVELLHNFIGNAAGPMFRRALPGEMAEILLRSSPLGDALPGIFVTQLVEAEVQGVGERARRGNRVRPAREQPRHLGRRFQMPLGIGVEEIARGRDRDLLADAGDDVLQRAAVGGVIMDVIGGEDRAALATRDPVEAFDPRRIVAAIEPARRDMAK